MKNCSGRWNRDGGRHRPAVPVLLGNSLMIASTAEATAPGIPSPPPPAANQAGQARLPAPPPEPLRPTHPTRAATLPTAHSRELQQGLAWAPIKDRVTLQGRGLAQRPDLVRARALAPSRMPLRERKDRWRVARGDARGLRGALARQPGPRHLAVDAPTSPTRLSPLPPTWVSPHWRKASV